jgi:DNA end-binding protein Ku
MARAIWSGAISFGLVNIPVKLYSAVQRKTVRFNQLDGEDNTRIQQKRVNADTGEEVPYDRLVKGYEISPDRYVVVEPGELDALQPEKTRTIDIQDFVDLHEIDPIFYDHPYYLAPGQGADKAYALLYSAMEASEKVGIARVVIRSKEQLVAIRPREGILAMETMLFSDEVVAPSEVGDLPDAKKAKASKKEVDMAQQLIESLTTEFDPSQYRDEYRDAVLEMIERKAEGHTVDVEAPPAPEAEEVPDLMAALEASISSSKRQSKGGGAKSESSSDGAKSKSSSNGTKSKAKSSSSSNGAKSKPKSSSRSKSKSSAKK